MAMTYTWLVKQIKIDQDSSVVQTIWEKRGTDENNNTGLFVGATPFNNADPNAEGYIPFKNLTESDVLGWIQAVVTGDYEAHVNEQIQRHIDEQAISESDLPWS